MKAVRQDYSEDAFFYEESFEDESRTVAWAPTVSEQEALFQALYVAMNERIEYLFKQKSDEAGSEAWFRITGGIYKEKLTALITGHQDWFYNDSEFQIFLREPDAPGYFAYDDHGIFFIYELPVRQILLGLGMAERKAPLIYNGSHWHGRPKDAAHTLEEFKEALCSASEFYEQVPDGA